MSIPLVQNNEKDSINTSLIAIKRQIERINMLLGLSNSEEIDTSKFATKEELQQAVTDLQPVDEVAVDNMHSVTSNAVAESCTKYPDYSKPIQIASSGVSVTSWIATKDCFVQFLFWSGSTSPLNLLINNNIVSTYDVYNGVVSQFSGYIKKGDVVSFSNNGNINRNDVLRLFELRS